MADPRLERCEYPEDPRRCQGSSATHGQCPFKAAEGTTLCHRHAADKVEAHNRLETMRMYKLAKWQERVSEFADHEQIKCLNEEVGILRMTLEQLVVQSQDPLKFIMNSNKITDLVASIERVLKSMHRMQVATGQLMDRQRAIEIGQSVVSIITDYVKDPIAVEEIAERILKLVME